MMPILFRLHNRDLSLFVPLATDDRPLTHVPVRHGDMLFLDSATDSIDPDDFGHFVQGTFVNLKFYQ